MQHRTADGGHRVKPLFDFLRTLGAPRIAAMGAVALFLAGFLIFVVTRISTGPMTPLYTDLTFEDSNAILSELDARALDYEIRQGGTVILVPQEQVLRLRMDLATAGLPSGGGVGYEIFDKGDSLGATSFVQNINHLRALEGELARSIRTIKGVQSARVHLVLPERQLFARERPEPSASIVLKSRGSLETAQIRAIQHLVASAVEGLSPGGVSVVDERGRLLASAASDDVQGITSTIEERRALIEHRLIEKVQSLVSSVVGNDRVRVRVSADLDMRRVTETKDLFDPESRVVRSTQLREEQSNASEPSGNQGVTIGNELPGAGQGGADAGSATQAATTTEEVVNYEISRTTSTQVLEAGSIRRISVAVVVDGVYTQAQNGDVTYAPRNQEELDRIAALVRTAVGFEEERGDTVEIVNLRFADLPIAAPVGATEAGFLSLDKRDYFYIAEVIVLLVVGILALLLVVRPLVRRILAESEAAAAITVSDADGNPVKLEAGETAGEAAALLAPGVPGTAAVTPAAGLPSQQSQVAAHIEQARAAGEVQTVALQQIGEMVETNPVEAAGIVRQWLQEAA